MYVCIMELENLLIKLKTIENTHPNIYRMWNVYLERKIKESKNIVINYNKMIEYVNINDEPPLDLLIFLTLLNIDNYTNV